jgi:cytochrome c peroxidase
VRPALGSSLALVFACAACAGDPAPAPGPKTGAPAVEDGFSADEWAVVQSLSPLPAVPPDPTNAYADDPRAAALGQRLFFDARASGQLVVGDDGTNGGLGAVGDSGKVACASCHAGPALDDRRSIPNNVSLGVDWGGRRALPLVDASYYAWSNWGGRFDSQWSLVLGATENPKVLASSRLRIAHLMFDAYRGEHDAIFPTKLDAALADAARFPAAGKPGDAAWSAMSTADQSHVDQIFVDYGKAIAAYLRLLVSKNAPFDRWVAGDHAAVSPSAKRGARLFVGTAKCVSCHSGPHFTDDDFHFDGVTQSGAHVPATDDGRTADLAALLQSPFNGVGTWADARASDKLARARQEFVRPGAFRTKSLRGVASSAPYMHCGKLPTLEAVVDHYAGLLAAPPPPAPGVWYWDTGSPPPPATTLTALEKADLVAFLQTLDGEPIDPHLFRAEGP